MRVKSTIWGVATIILALLFSTVALLTPSKTSGEEAAFNGFTHTVFAENATDTG